MSGFFLFFFAIASPIRAKLSGLRNEESLHCSLQIFIFEAFSSYSLYLLFRCTTQKDAAAIWARGVVVLDNC